MSFFSKFIRKVLVGLPFGEIWPDKPAPPPPAADGRTAALRILRTYISELTFYRDGDAIGKPLIPFKIPIERIHIEWPDDEDEIKDLPAIAFLSGGDIDYQFVGMGSWLDEDTRDVHGKNTALQVQSDNVEPIHIEVLCKTKHERRAIREGIKTALSPTEAMAGIRFRMPDFYNQVVCFSVDRTTIIEDENSSKGRRGLRMIVEMSYLDVALVNVVPMTPVLQTFVDTEDGVTQLTLDAETDRIADEGAEDEPTEPWVDRP